MEVPPKPVYAFLRGPCSKLGANRASSLTPTLETRPVADRPSWRDSAEPSSASLFILERTRARTVFRVSKHCTSYTPAMFFVGRAVRAPALARHRRVRGVTLTRLPDCRAQRPQIRCHFPVTNQSAVKKQNCLVPFSIPRRSRGQGSAVLAALRRCAPRLSRLRRALTAALRRDRPRHRAIPP